MNMHVQGIHVLHFSFCLCDRSRLRHRSLLITLYAVLLGDEYHRHDGDLLLRQLHRHNKLHTEPVDP